MHARAKALGSWVSCPPAVKRGPWGPHIQSCGDLSPADPGSSHPHRLAQPCVCGGWGVGVGPALPQGAPCRLAPNHTLLLFLRVYWGLITITRFTWPLGRFKAFCVPPGPVPGMGAIVANVGWGSWDQGCRSPGWVGDFAFPGPCLHKNQNTVKMRFYGCIGLKTNITIWESISLF